MKRIDELRAFWERLSSRERLGLGAAGCALGLFLAYVLVLNPLLSGLDAASRRIRRERALYFWIARHASRLTGSAAPKPVPLPSFRAGVQNQLLRLFGHGHALKVDAKGQGRLTVVMKAVPYERFLSDFLPFLVRHGIGLRRIRITEKVPGSNLVDVTVELVHHAQTP